MLLSSGLLAPDLSSSAAVVCEKVALALISDPLKASIVSAILLSDQMRLSIRWQRLIRLEQSLQWSLSCRVLGRRLTLDPPSVPLRFFRPRKGLVSTVCW